MLLHGRLVTAVFEQASVTTIFYDANSFAGAALVEDAQVWLDVLDVRQLRQLD